MDREGEARRRYLDDACGGDPSLREEVETLLQLTELQDDFLERPLFHAATDLLAQDGIDAPRRTPVEELHGRFLPGDVLSNRYRIAGLLGRGGMGEVYRADDLRLQQPVALKFLAEPLARDGASLARFHREVSVARQISHRHVCRVYDIGEHAGMHFLSMELVRGETLSSLLKRIGRLPIDKAVEIAQQLCTGLAAIHAAGVLHRDLKPANIMIDERGDVRITDFGIAAAAEGVAGREAMIGTPGYMAPEQRTGGTLTPRSDLYALGIVLFECFTGRGPATHPTAPDLDPRVERILLRCLEEDPARRPATALQVLAALPGGDPIAAALAAGETPSPQMIAAAPAEGSLRPWVAGMLLAWIVAATILIAAISDRTTLPHLVPLEHSPAVLHERAGNLARAAGYTTSADTAEGFTLDGEALDFVARDPSPERWQRLRGGKPPVVVYWYRQSPAPIEPYDAWRIDRDDPPTTLPGMVTMQLDPAGRLLSFEGAPPANGTTPRAEVDWMPFFAAAGLDASQFRRDASRSTPPQHSDVRLAWIGADPIRGDLPLRIEAASYAGRVTWFAVLGPWHAPSPEPAGRSGERHYTIALMVLYFGAMALAALLAWHNVRVGRGDRRGAFRLALFTFAMRMVYWIFFAHHVPTLGEVRGGFVNALQSALYWSCLIALLHLALEPFVRRRWPEWTISWSRLLAGDFRDPMVGRDVLVGGAFGLAVIIAANLYALVPQLLGRPIPEPSGTSPLLIEFGLLGLRGFVLLLLNQTSASILFSFVLLSLLLFFAMLTRSSRAAIAIGWLVLYGALMLNVPDPSLPDFAIGTLVPLLLLVTLTRYGVLALIAAFFFSHLWAFFPATTDLGAWYATSFLLEVGVLMILSIAAFRTSIAGEQWFRSDFLDG